MTPWSTTITHFILKVSMGSKCIWVSKSYSITDLTNSMCLGTFPTGEARLLFSSKQVDYIRYWLHAMQLTKKMIPMPYSDCLLTESDLRSVSPAVYPDGGSLRKAIKASGKSIYGRLLILFLTMQTIEKNNKRLKGANPLLSHRRNLFERVRTFWAEKKGVWCAIDFEAWEMEHTLLTEFGSSFIGWQDNRMISEQQHLIVEEALLYRNSKYVPDYRDVSVFF